MRTEMCILKGNVGKFYHIEFNILKKHELWVSAELTKCNSQVWFLGVMVQESMKENVNFRCVV